MLTLARSSCMLLSELWRVYLADESGNEQQHQDAVVISSVTQEGLGHEGGQQRDVSVSLTHLHLPQLHLNGLKTTQHREHVFKTQDTDI